MKTMKKVWVVLGYIGVYTSQVYGDYFLNHYNDPYSTTSIMEYFFRSL